MTAWAAKDSRSCSRQRARIRIIVTTTGTIPPLLTRPNQEVSHRVAFRLLDAVKLFDIIYIMTGGGPGTNTYTAAFYLYEKGFQEFHISQATAGSWMFLILTIPVISVLVRRLLRPETA